MYSKTKKTFIHFFLKHSKTNFFMKEQFMKYLGTGITVVVAMLITTNFIQPMWNKAKVSSPSMQ